MSDKDQMRSLGKIVVFSFFLTACGEKQVKVPDYTISGQNYSNDAVVLKKQFSQCQSSKFKTLLRDFTFPSFQEAQIKSTSKDFSPMLEGIFLKNQNVISQTLYGEETDWLVADRGFYVESIKIPKDVFICPEEIEYERETVEAAALNASYFIRKTHLKFTSLISDISVSPIILNIGALITQSYLYKGGDGKTYKESSYMTDNAFYKPSNRSVTFLPHSRFFKAYGFKMNYWEVPMVAAHEYGHHLFQMIYKQDFLSSSDHHKGCFGPAKVPRKNSRNKSLLRKVKVDDVVNAYNEGFSDLISFYTLDPAERGVDQVKCLEVTRDVNSPVFYDGKPKIFGKEALRSFFSPHSDPNDSCEAASYQSIHNFGAIMAHSMDTFLSDFTNSDDEKLLAVVEWVKFQRIERKMLLLAKPENFFKLTLNEFIRMSLKRFEAEFDEENCKKIKNIFPENELTECSLEKDL